jgi:hypothetical protein
MIKNDRYRNSNLTYIRYYGSVYCLTFLGISQMLYILCCILSTTLTLCMVVLQQPILFNYFVVFLIKLRDEFARINLKNSTRNFANVFKKKICPWNHNSLEIFQVLQVCIVLHISETTTFCDRYWKHCDFVYSYVN